MAESVPSPAPLASDASGTGVRAPAPAIFAAAFALGLLLDLAAPLDPAAALDKRLLMGVPFVAAGLGLALWAASTMRAAGTTLDPRGTATKLVTAGPYARSRNPIYLGFALFYGGVAVILPSLWALLLLPLAILAVRHAVIAPEERHLERAFGGAWLDYARRVRRWM
ncbi:MAG TPA: isoprenylcysteine carboxylmethyltransferase family protein [Candidatus Thermoplasmatota archaeon]|nr:isoprenylcysteine carboxylmethyltransferase family protein [Candidatus Thermoplasmatota archaeon]